MLPKRIPKGPKRESRWRSQALTELLIYDAVLGKLFWRKRPRKMFVDERSFMTWNTRFAGKEAFTANHSAGYKTGRINGVQEFAHRVIWIMLHDNADGEIDHINGVRSDNRICNLRLVSREENRLNVKAQSNCPYGVPGVYFRGKSWEARIQHDGWGRYLGRFSSFEKAVAARKSAEIKLGFHHNHGRT